MILVRISENGKMTIPAEIRQYLRLKPGDKVLFTLKPNGEIILRNASSEAIPSAQAAFAGAAQVMGVSNDKEVQALVDEVRYGRQA